LSGFSTKAEILFGAKHISGSVNGMRCYSGIPSDASVKRRSGSKSRLLGLVARTGGVVPHLAATGLELKKSRNTLVIMPTTYHLEATGTKLLILLVVMDMQRNQRAVTMTLTLKSPKRTPLMIIRWPQKLEI
jgi:hypothetical protein